MSTSKVQASFGQPIAAKTDENRRLWRELRCLNCRHWFGDEYIRDGRIRLKCPKCDRITVMEFRPFKPGSGRCPSKQLNDKESNK